MLNFAIFLNAIKVFILAQNECVTSSSGKCDSQFLYEEYSGVLRPDEPISLNDQATMRCTSYTKELGMYVIYSKNNKFEGESMVLTLTPSSREIEMSNKAVFQNDEAVISEKLTSPKAI